MALAIERGLSFAEKAEREYQRVSEARLMRRQQEAAAVSAPQKNEAATSQEQRAVVILQETLGNIIANFLTNIEFKNPNVAIVDRNLRAKEKSKLS